MENIKISYYKTSLGELILGSYKEKLCLCDWRYRKMRDSIDRRIQNQLNSHYVIEESKVVKQAIEQIDQYLIHERKEFNIPLLLVGTDFQKKIWKTLMDIPFGAVSTYKKQAEKMGDPNAVRAVANANGANSIAIIIPCHRIIGSNGKLVGYAGGLSVKQKLLEIEQDMFTLFDS